MYKAKHIAWYYNLFPRINPPFSYCNKVSLFSVTHYILVIYKPLPIFQHLYYFAKPIFLHCSIISPYHSHCCLYELCQNFKPLAMLKPSNNLLFISLLDLAYLLFSFVICLSFLYLPVWLAPSFVRLLFVFPISSPYLHYFILPPPFANSQIC